MGYGTATPVDPRDTAARMIAAAEYFKSAGYLPAWARDDLPPKTGAAASGGAFTLAAF